MTAEPAAPRPSTPLPVAAPATFALPSSAGVLDAVPGPVTPAHLGGDGLDDSRVARWLARALAADAARPPTAGTGFDPRRTPAWSPSFYAKGF